MGDAARPPATGDNIIRPVFDGRIKRTNCLYKQFLLFPQCLQKASFLDASKGVIMCERVKRESSKWLEENTVWTTAKP